MAQSSPMPRRRNFEGEVEARVRMRSMRRSSPRGLVEVREWGGWGTDFRVNVMGDGVVRVREVACISGKLVYFNEEEGVFPWKDDTGT
jgi:hypothetical protein